MFHSSEASTSKRPERLILTASRRKGMNQKSNEERSQERIKVQDAVWICVKSNYLEYLKIIDQEDPEYFPSINQPMVKIYLGNSSNLEFLYFMAAKDPQVGFSEQFQNFAERLHFQCQFCPLIGSALIRQRPDDLPKNRDEVTQEDTHMCDS